MFKTILVGLDGSDGARNALPFAIGLARRDGAKLVLAHIEDDIVGKGGGPIHVDEEEVRAEIRRQAEELTSEGTETKVETANVRLGGPAPVLAAMADRTGADLIVVGTRGQSALAGVLLGSVVQRLLHLAHQPLMAVPAEAHAPEEDGAVEDKVESSVAS